MDDVGISGAPIGIFASGTGANLAVRNSTFSDGTTGICSADAGQTLFIENNLFSNLNTGIVISDNSGNVTSANLTAIDNTFSGALAVISSPSRPAPSICCPEAPAMWMPLTRTLVSA